MFHIFAVRGRRETHVSCPKPLLVERSHCMRTIVDPDLCILCGLCADTCPDVYELGDETAIVIADPIPSGQEDCALEAEEGCPTDAISHE